MASKKQKRKNRAMALANQANEAVKAYTGSAYYGFGYGASSTPDMRPDEYGAAQAYTFNVAVNAAIAFWESWLDGIVWKLKTDAGDKVLVSSDMRRFPKEGYGAKFAQAIKFHEQGFKHSLFKSIAFSDMLYGETYIRYICNDFRVPQLLEWLNPLAVEPDITMGYIRNYRYSAAEGYETLSPKEMAYRIAKRDANNDLRGQSRVLAAIDALNLEANQKKAFKSYFKNGMNLGGVLSPVSPETSLSPAQVMQLEDQFIKEHKGAGNAGKWAIAPTNMNITAFDSVDAEKNYSIIQPLRDEILMAMGVYPQLVGDPSNANYDNTDDMKRQWREMWGIPYAKEVQGYINDLILPSLEPYTPIYFDFDFSPYEVEKPEVVSADFSAGFVDMYNAAEMRGYDGNPRLKGIYVINGMPMHETIIEKLAHSIPSQYQLDMAQASEAEAQADATISSPVTPVLPAPNGHETLPDDWTEEEAVGNEQVIETALHEEALSQGHKHSHDALPPITQADNVSELDELAAWRKFLQNGKSSKRMFEQKALRGDIGDALQAAVETKDKQTILDAFKAAQDRIDARIKAIQSTRLDYERDFTELLGRARSERMQRVQWSSAMRAIDRRYVRKAYTDGMIDGGVEDDPSEDDLISMNEITTSNSAYITELGNVLFKEDGISDAQADVKAAMWFNKSIEPAYQAGLLSADANGLYEWVYGDTEHCEDCKRLNGQRHRLKGWKAHYMPKSELLDCKGFACACSIVKVKGRQRGNY